MILTSRLRLRALTLNDLALFRALYCDPGTMRHVGKPMSRARAAASLGATIAATRKPRGLRFFVIAERKSRRGVGMCSLRPAAWDKRGVEAGLMLLPAASGRGYAREALSALIETAFFQLRAGAVWVQYRRANMAAGRLCDATGFRKEFSHLRGTNIRRCVRIPRRLEWRDVSYQSKRGKTMSNIVRFLEQAGSNAAMRHANRTELLRLMQQESAADPVISPREKMYCLVFSTKPPKKKPAKKKPAKAPAKKKPAKKAPAKKTPARRKKS